MLSPDLAQQYSLTDNGTHFRFEVPFSSPDVVYEVFIFLNLFLQLVWWIKLPCKVSPVSSSSSQAVESSSIKNRLDVALRNLETNTNINEFSVSCSFLSTLTGLYFCVYFIYHQPWHKLNPCSSSSRVLPERDHDRSGCEAGVCPQPEPQSAHTQRPQLWSHLQRWPLRLFRLHWELLWDHQKGRVPINIFLMQAVNGETDKSHLSCSF